PAQSFRGGSAALDLPPGLGADLRRLARGRGATLFMVLLAAWQALLARPSRPDDFALRPPVANRGLPELEDPVGCLLHTLALRARGGATFADRLERVRATALAAYDHADLPFERLVDELNPARDRSRQPFVQTLLTLDSTPAVPLALDGLAVEELP